MMKPLEDKLEQILVKKAPFQLPENGRRGLANAMPWVSLVVGVLALFAAWGLYQAAVITTNYVNYANYLTTAAGYGPTTTGLTPILWVSLGLLVAEAVMLIIAFPGLKAHKKSGWNIMFYVTLLNVVYAVVYLFADQNFASFVMSLISTVIGLYFLFQVRSYFMGTAAKGASKPSTTTGSGTDVGNGKPTSK